MDSLQHPTWFQRNWKWFVPLGCIGAIVIGTSFLAAIAALIFGMIKSSDPYRDGLARAQGNAAVVAALGAPVKPGFLVSGSLSETGASGHAELAIPISGPKGDGTVYVTSVKSAGQWTYVNLVVEVSATKERIDLKP
jgi:hypothetical protein